MSTPLFTPSRRDVRAFFVDTWRKRQAGEPLEPIETQALDWIERHPEYHALLERGDDALERDFSPEHGESNPFLHLSLHLALAEQLAIDQPPGIRALFARLAAGQPDVHAAAHVAIECLAATLWEMQRAGPQSDTARFGAAYLDALRRKIRGA